MRMEVWAPLADHVDVVVDGDARAMRAADHPDDPERTGWWQLEDDRLVPGTDYAFSLDGGEPRPDPRSAWQPHGVHGPSRLVDTGAFPWTDGDWGGFELASAVLYELHVGTFTRAGTFAAATERLDHLVDLGIDAVEVMPVNAFPGAHGWGYDGVALYAVHDAYGGPEAFAAFVDACHARGLGVVLDVVYNHLGPDGNYLAEFGPYFTDRYGTPWGRAVNLDDAHSDHVRRFIVDNALRWLSDFHVDALRLDAVHALYDASAVHVLEQLADEVGSRSQQLGRRLHLIAESDLNHPRLVQPDERGGYGLDASWSDDLHHALHVALTGEQDGYYADFEGARDTAYALEHGWVYDGRYSPHRRRSHGRPLPDDVPSTQLVGYVQNHDQVGNRARGERLTHLVGHPDLLQVAAAIVLTAPQVPMLWMGEEWGATTPFPYFTDHQDPALQEAVRAGRRDEFAAFGWDPKDVLDPQDPATFTSAKLDWDEPATPRHAQQLDWYRQLIRLRRAVPALTDGRRDTTEARTDAEGSWITVRRGSILVVANLTDRELEVTVPGGVPDHLLLASPSDGGSARAHAVVAPPYGASVYGDGDARERWEAARDGG